MVKSRWAADHRKRPNQLMMQALLCLLKIRLNHRQPKQRRDASNGNFSKVNM